MEAHEKSLHGSVNGNFSFKRRPDGSLDKGTVVCKWCKKELAYHRSTSSLRYHLNAKHFAALGNGDPADPAAGSGSSSRQSRKAKLDKMTGFRAKMSKNTADKVRNALARWIAADCRPLSVVEDPGLQAVLQEASSDPTYELPSRKTVTDTICQMYDTEKQARVHLLEKAECVAVTGDHWTSDNNTDYVAVTAHVIDEWRLKSFALAVHETNSTERDEKCTELFESVAGTWRIQHKITTTGADAMLPAGDMPCVARILQGTITACLSDGGFSDALLQKCRHIAAHFKDSPAHIEQLHWEQTALGQSNEPLIEDVFMRWNSTLEMISRLLRNQQAVKAALSQQQQHALPVLTAAEWDGLQGLASVLDSCRYVTELLGGESYVSCSVVLPALCHLDRTMKVSDEDPDYVARFKTAFSKDLARRQATLNHEWLKLATVLDPRFKDLKCLPKAEREAVWTGLEALLQKESKSAAAAPPTEPPAKRRLLLCASESDTDDDDDNEGPRRALSRYGAEPTISETDCPLQWWSTHAGAHPQVSVLARRFLGSPATSVPADRLFSLTGHVAEKQRAALGSENVDILVCLGSWLKAKEKPTSQDYVYKVYV